MNTILLCCTLLCPPDAVAIGVGVGVNVTTLSGTPVTSVVVGQTVYIYTVLSYIPVDPISGGASTSFTGGTLTLTLGGQECSAAVPVTIGFPNCGGVIAWRMTNLFRSTQPGVYPLPARYSGGQSAFGTINATGGGSINVAPLDRIRTERQVGGLRLWWYAQSPCLLQASTDLRAWADRTIITPTNGVCSITLPVSGKEFYRYAIQ